jgi:hypothetical protein
MNQRIRVLDNKKVSKKPLKEIRDGLDKLEGLEVKSISLCLILIFNF